MSQRLSYEALSHLKTDAAGPGYHPRSVGVGIVHIGAGAFHRAHQAVYTDSALAAEGGDWRIIGVSLRSTDITDTLDAQDGLFTVVERSGSGDRARVIGSVARVLAASRDPEAVLAALADPQVRVVTLTVTEKAYGLDRITGDVNVRHPAIASDLQSPGRPQGVLGILVEGLRMRRDAGLPPYAVLCCDNLPENGTLVRDGVLAFARRIDPDLARYIEAKVSFPSSMVDRITPAATDETRERAASLTGFVDDAAIETEPFSQWVIEDRFPQGRPAWQAWGAIFVDDVAPYERMKLRMLNGSHSMIAYAGFLSGHDLVRDVMRDPDLEPLVRRHIAAAALTLAPLQGIDLGSYAQQLADRFANPAIAHKTYQIAMDGTEKLPQRIVAPALDALRQGSDVRPYAFAFAAWARYCLGVTESGERYELRDPRQEQIAEVVQAAHGDTGRIMHGLLSLPNVFPEELIRAASFVEISRGILKAMLAEGIRSTIRSEAAP